jgi:chromosomal replication initiator protein
VLDGIVEIPLSGQSITLAPQGAADQPPRLALCQFVVGPENALVSVAVQAVLDPAGTAYWPLVLYGPSGSGKSHLAHGLAAAWKAEFSRLPVVLTTAIDFARELAEAIETKTTDDFGGRYRQAALLVLEDLQHLVGKDAAQQELIHILDALADAQARVVVTSQVAPGLLAGLLPALQSRLSAGLAVPLVLPSHEARLAILQRVAAEREINVSSEVLQVLAEGLDTPVPDMVAAFGHLELAARTQRAPIDAALARRYLAERTTAQQPSLREIALLTARHFSLTLGELRSATRRRAVVTARGVAMYLARLLTTNSLDEIGQYFGGRDHTTVAHGCRKTEELLASEPTIRLAVEQLQAKL